MISGLPRLSYLRYFVCHLLLPIFYQDAAKAYRMTDKSQTSPAVNTAGEGILRPSTGTIDPEFSKRITALRFVLAVFVVFIHNQVVKEIHFADGDIIVDMPTWIQVIHDTFAFYLGGIAVPIFFIISGYLFFAKTKPLGVIIKKKFKGIFVPYILWTFLAIILFYIAQSIEYSKPFFTQPENIIKNWSISDVLESLWARHFAANPETTLHCPFVAPFWYIRDLMIMMLISPLIKFGASKFPAAWLIFVTILNSAEIFGATHIEYGFTIALFFFSLGYYAVNYIGKVIEFIDSFKWRDFLIAYVFSFVLTIYSNMNSLGSGFFDWFNLLFTICLVFKAAGLVVNNQKLFEKLAYLSGFSFWIFAAHLPFVLPVMRKLSTKIIPMHGAWILVQFFGVVILCVSLLLIIGIVIKKWLPKVYALFTGGR